MLRSQHGLLASAALTELPTSRATRTASQPFRLLLCGRLHLPLPWSHRTCRCSSTYLATIAQRAQRQGCWGRERSLSSAPQHKSAGTGNFQRAGRAQAGDCGGWFDKFHLKPLSSKTIFIIKQLSSKNHSRRRFHRNTAHARLLGFNGDVPHEGLLKVIRFGCLGVWVFWCCGSKIFEIGFLMKVVF